MSDEADGAEVRLVDAAAGYVTYVDWLLHVAAFEGVVNASLGTVNYAVHPASVKSTVNLRMPVAVAKRLHAALGVAISSAEGPNG